MPQKTNIYNYNTPQADSNIYAPPYQQGGKPNKQPKQNNHKFPLWKNVLAMIILIVVLVCAAYWGANIYTRHGMEVAVPDVKGLTVEQAISKLEQLGLQGEITDSIYSKTVAPGLICEQSIYPGNYVKIDRIISLRVSSNQAPTLILPDGIINNSSKREATARLTSMGFNVTEPEYTFGQRDWVLGIKSNGRNITAGSRVNVDDAITLIVGNGHYEDEDNYSTDNYDIAPDSAYSVYDYNETSDSY